jgi:transcriptional regulator with XRE-family HTH domain
MTNTSSDRLKIVARLRGIPDAPALAELTGINLSTVRSNLNGHRQVSKQTAPKYAQKLKTTVDWLLYGRGQTPTSQEVPDGPPAGALGIIDEIVPTLKVQRSQAIVTPAGTTGLAFLDQEGKAIAVEVDRESIDQIRKNLASLEAFLARLA